MQHLVYERERERNSYIISSVVNGQEPFLPNHFSIIVKNFNIVKNESVFRDDVQANSFHDSVFHDTL